VSDQLKGA